MWNRCSPNDVLKMTCHFSKGKKKVTKDRQHPILTKWDYN